MAAVAALEAIGRFISFMTVSTKPLATSEKVKAQGHFVGLVISILCPQLA